MRLSYRVESTYVSPEDGLNHRFIFLLSLGGQTYRYSLARFTTTSLNIGMAFVRFDSGESDSIWLRDWGSRKTRAGLSQHLREMRLPPLPGMITRMLFLFLNSNRTRPVAEKIYEGLLRRYRMCSEYRHQLSSSRARHDYDPMMTIGPEDMLHGDFLAPESRKLLKGFTNA